MILEVFPSGPIDTNVVLLACETSRKAVVIDAPQGSAEVILYRVQALNLSVQMVLFTHSHQDHIADALKMKKNFDAPLYIHPLDAPNLEHPGADLLPSFIPVVGVKPDHFIEDGARLLVGDLEIEVLHTPGHTPGGVCFYLKKEKVLISGDTLFRGTMGRVDFPLADPQAMVLSLKKLALLPGDVEVFPGHGGGTLIKNEVEWIRLLAQL